MAMSSSVQIRHAVSIAGKVTDVLKATEKRGRPIAGAELELLDGPEEFQATVDIRSRDPLWLQRKERLNHTVSRADGLFYFLDLPPGGPYRIRVTVPHLFTRYGDRQEHGGIDVAPAPQSPASKVEVRWVDIALVSTGVSGKVITARNGAEEPVARATVRIQDAKTETEDDGTFSIDGLIGPRDEARFETPKAVLSVTAKGFEDSPPIEIDLKVGEIVIAEDIEIKLKGG